MSAAREPVSGTLIVWSDRQGRTHQAMLTVYRRNLGDPTGRVPWSIMREAAAKAGLDFDDSAYSEDEKV